ncbi:MAG: domain S-box [Planctomycetota bacterium]|nr:domain S-box [Planctomycetota bacterium]
MNVSDLPRILSSRPIRYSLAVLTVAVATVLRFGLNPLLGERQPYVLFYLAVILTAWQGGLGPSVLALVLSCVSAVWFFVPAHNPLRPGDPTDLIGFGLFIAVCLSIVAFSEAHRAARRRLEGEVTIRRRAEEAERTQREQLRATLASVGDGVIATDAEGRVVMLNRVAQALTRWSEGEAAGKPMAEVLPIIDEATRQAVEDPVSRVIREGVVVGQAKHAVLVARDGTETPVEDSAAPILDDQGNTAGAVVVFRDTSERRRHEAAVEEQRRLSEFGRDVGLALTECPDMATMLDCCTALTVKHLDAAFARVWTLDAGSRVLELRASSGLYSHLDGPHARVTVGEYKIGMIAQQRMPHLTNSVLGDPLVPAQDWAKREGLVAFAGYPLIVEERLVGVWAMFARHALSEATLRAMDPVARALALGIERRRAADALAESEAWLATTLASIGDALIATDRHGNVRFLNPVAETLTGWSREVASGRSMHEVFHIINEHTRLPAENPIERVIREGVVVGLANHTILIARDGTETPIEDSAAPIRDEAGGVAGVVMVFRDVTEGRAARRLLQQSEERKAAILQSALDAIITIDHEGKVLEFNPAAQRIFGLAPADVIGREMCDLIVPASYRDAHRRGMAHFLATGAGPVLGQRIEISALRGDGTEFPIELAIALISNDGPPVFTAHLRDITERRRAEEALRVSMQAAEDASRAKDHFLAVLSHELRTPLNPILLATTAMLERPDDPEEFRPTLEMIRQNINLQARLIDDLLDVMRIVRGKMPLQWEVADCHTLIERAVQICQSEVFGKELQLELDLAAEYHHVNADPARIQQVLWNLIKNAVKFTPSGGLVSIRTSNPLANGRGDRLLIEVSDTGIGIEPEVLSRIFDPFQQGETSITRRFGGLGLGLAIGKGIVDGHGGVLSADSAGTNRGTTFRIELKALPESSSGGNGAASPRISVEAPAAMTPRSILLVEDEQATVRLMARLLRGLGHQVTTASTIADALEAERSGNFDLIVSDIGLPDGSGLDLMRRVVARRGPIPAIALTGYGMEEDIQRSREAGFTAHMTKPIDFAKLETMIRQVAS